MGGRITVFWGLLCLVATLSFAQPPVIQVDETMSDRGEFYHVVMAQRDTVEPGVYLTGIGRQQFYQAYAVKMDESGAPTWSRLWGQTLFMYDCLWRNGSGRMVGYTTENSTNDYKVVLFNGAGSLQGQWDFGGNARADRAFSSMYYDSVNMLIVGMVDPGDSSLTDGSLVLVDDQGSVEWSRTYHESAVIRRVQRVDSANLILFGTADSAAGRNKDFWVGHTDSAGTLLSSHRFGASKAEELFDAVRVDSSLTLLLGSTHSFGDSTKTNIFVLATNDSGDSLWSDVLGGPENDAGLCILPVADRDSVVVHYHDPERLLSDLKGMGERSAFMPGAIQPLPRRVLRHAMALYRDRFADADGRVRATFEIVHVSGWAPAPGQPKPLKPGSAKVSLADTIGRPKPPETSG